ncbi:MAG: VOC family protein [Methanomicrobia archaeon]|nr:VOC family protein [Methanomicrobia archaeon]
MNIEVNHITLSVKDVEESFAFYTQVLGFRPVAKWQEGAYLLAGDMRIILVLDKHARETIVPEGSSIPLHRPKYTHIAFTVSAPYFEPLNKRIKFSGAEILQNNWTEGTSLYFVDPNGHKLEIHASDPETRIGAAKETLWEDWNSLFNKLKGNGS